MAQVSTPWEQRQRLAEIELEVTLWESQGREVEALRVVVEHLRGGGDPVLVAPERLDTLFQLAHLGGLVPAWGHARWVLQQAARSRAPGMAELDAEAVARSAQLWDETADLEPYRPAPERDWVRRQLLLHDLGGLRLFLDEVAAPRLVARAGRVGDWAGVPMRGLRLLDAGEGRLRWRDLATAHEHEVPDLGGAHVVGVGQHAIGRLVPVEGGEMLESSPLAVPGRTARRVARHPDDWLAAVVDAWHDPDPHEDPPDLEHELAALTDVPATWQDWLLLLVAHDHGWGSEPPLDGDDDETLRRRVGREQRVCFALVRDALAGDLQGRLARMDFEEPVDLWPVVGRVLLQAPALGPLLQGEDPLSRGDLRRLASLVPEPAAALCRHLLARDEAA